MDYEGQLKYLQQKHEEVKTGYAKLFCEKMELDYSDAYFEGTVFCVGDYFIDMKTIVWAMDNEVCEKKFFDWYDYNLFLGENDLGDVTLERYCKNDKPYTEECVKKLREAKDRLLDAQREFDLLLLKAKNEHGD